MPKTSGAPRSTATSARQSPPSARETATSSRTLAGSWIAVGLRHGSSATESARSSPAARTLSTSNSPPAWDTTPTPAASVRTRGYSPVDSRTRKVLLPRDDRDPRQATSSQVRSTFRHSAPGIRSSSANGPGSLDGQPCGPRGGRGAWWCLPDRRPQGADRWTGMVGCRTLPFLEVVRGLRGEADVVDACAVVDGDLADHLAVVRGGCCRRTGVIASSAPAPSARRSSDPARGPEPGRACGRAVARGRAGGAASTSLRVCCSLLCCSSPGCATRL